MVPTAQRDQVVEVRQSTIDPMHDMVDVGELGVAATGESTALVPAIDFHPLHRSGIPAGPPLIQDRPFRILHGEIHVGVAGESTDNLGRNGSDSGDFGHGVICATDEQLEGRMHDDPGRTAAPVARALPDPLAEPLADPLPIWKSPISSS